MKKHILPALFLCVSLGSAGSAVADTENWCGTYFEENGRGYIRLARDDFGIGSSNCSLDGYAQRAEKSGTAKIALNFTRNRSTVTKWRKFHNHLIEVRGEFQNGYISGTRFVRDMGV